MGGEEFLWFIIDEEDRRILSFVGLIGMRFYLDFDFEVRFRGGYY